MAVDVADLHGKHHNSPVARPQRALSSTGERARKFRSPCPFSCGPRDTPAVAWLPSELVAHPVDGEDVLRVPRNRLDFLAQPGDVDVDGARRRHRVVAPDLVEQLLAGQRRAAVLDEVAQQLELARRQLERLAVPGDLGLAEVDATSPNW